MASLGFVSNTVGAVGKGAPCGPKGGILSNLPLAMQRMAMGKGGVGKPEVGPIANAMRPHPSAKSFQDQRVE